MKRRSEEKLFKDRNLNSASMKRWTKYGLIFLGIYVVINLIFLIIGSIGILVPLNSIGLFVVNFLGYNLMNSSVIDRYFILMISISGLFWFLLGALIGLAIDKIKRK